MPTSEGEARIGRFEGAALVGGKQGSDSAPLGNADYPDTRRLLLVNLASA
jgi:hypothetical protein